MALAPMRSALAPLPDLGDPVPMRSPLLILAAGVLGCNVSQSGTHGALEFTPRDCGNPLLGCDFARPVASGTSLNLWVWGDPQPDTVVAEAPGPATLTEIAPVEGRRTWRIDALADGTAIISARDAGGAEMDTYQVSVMAPTALELVGLVGHPTTSRNADGVTLDVEAAAGQLVSLQAVPRALGTDLMGVARYALVVPDGSTLLTTQQSTSKPEAGYLYVQPTAGDYPFRFQLVDQPGLGIDAVLHAR
jgi:hypothetical protein